MRIKRFSHKRSLCERLTGARACSDAVLQALFERWPPLEADGIAIRHASLRIAWRDKSRSPICFNVLIVKYNVRQMFVSANTNN